MRDLIITQNVTLDGVIDATGGWFAPSGHDDADETDMIEALAEQREAADAFLVGRTTFEEMRSFWPRQTDDETGVADYLNRVHKYVASSTLTDPGWEPTTILSGPLEDEVRALEQAPGSDIVVTGSLTLVPALIASGLVDEYRQFVYPVVLGEGRRLLDTALPRLELLEARPFRNGVVLLRHRA